MIECPEDILVEFQNYSLGEWSEKHIDALIEAILLSPGEVSAKLIQLELKGLVEQSDGKRFIANYH